MIKFLIRYKIVISLFVLILIGGILRFYDLMWGAPFFFHPDERNIASAISALHFPDQLNPHFFAYGSLPIYVTYLIGSVINYFQTCHSSLVSCHFPPTISFEQAILILRALSALFSLLLIPLLFLIGKLIKNEATGLLAAFFATTSIGLIQYAHFGTYELWLTFLGVLLFLVHILLWKKKKKRYLYFQIVIFALLVATKISSLALLPLLFIFPELWSKKSFLIRSFIFIRHTVLVSTLTLFIFLLTNPFSFLDFQSFYNSLVYESSVATGSMLVFYTGEFAQTLPVVYHFLYIYPFLLNPLLFSLLIPSLLLVIVLSIKHRSLPLLLILTYTGILFLSQVFLFVKWTRYLIPTLPFLYLLLAVALSTCKDYLRQLLPKQLLHFGYILGGSICALFALAFVITVYERPDTRGEAAAFAEEQLNRDSKIISEVYDLGIVPFSEHFSSIELFNFYDLDNNSPEFNLTTLEQKLEEAKYLILPSQRILKSRLLHSETFPHGAKFYTSLFYEQEDFSELYRTPCDSWCKITYWGDPIFAFEGTVNIFDRPTVLIYQKNNL